MYAVFNIFVCIHVFSNAVIVIVRMLYTDWLSRASHYGNTYASVSIRIQPKFIL